MLSRVADALYWMGRYLERSENITRLLLVTDDFSTETQGLAEQVAQAAWKDLLAIFPAAQVAPPASAFAPMSQAYLVAFFLDPANPYSVHYSLRKARENARSVREALTVEAFLTINETFRVLEGHTRRGLTDPPALREALGATHRGLFTTIGAIEHTFTRDESWLFLKLGESLERVYRTALVLRAKLPGLGAAEPRADVTLYYTQWRTLLRALGSLENYRRAWGAHLEPELVVQFLLFDQHSPRSLRYGAETVKTHLERIAGEPGPAARLVGRLHADLCYHDGAVAGGEYAGFLDRVVDVMGQTHDALGAQYFAT
ncbi:MAG: hypothetical protein DMD91_32060 [Candidatus Rokuibacteriota bacterium]|nr:MAG: hypothetical protein DMD91_32060 [Candidatus Rokubacteria bacterium]